jgi:hypothetical protein
VTKVNLSEKIEGSNSGDDDDCYRKGELILTKILHRVFAMIFSLTRILMCD